MSFIRNTLGVLSPWSFWMTLRMKGSYVGKDYLGNKYYRGKARKGYRHERRWVKYSGEVEASSVPPEWHGWLHHQTDIFPSEDGLSYRREWQKRHTSNQTGTNARYLPEGHSLAQGERAKASGDYQAWTPE